MVSLYLRDKGVRQFVNLGAGMDTRPFRISQLEATETTWFEVDFPAVTEYKNTMLASANAQPKCARHCVVANLTQKGWTAELEKKGFDPKAPTLYLLFPTLRFFILFLIVPFPGGWLKD